MQIKIRKYRPRLRLTEYTSLFVRSTAPGRPRAGARGENRAGTTEGHEQSKFYFQSNHGARVRTGFYFSYSDKLQD